MDKPITFFYQIHFYCKDAGHLLEKNFGDQDIRSFHLEITACTRYVGMVFLLFKRTVTLFFISSIKESPVCLFFASRNHPFVYFFYQGIFLLSLLLSRNLPFVVLFLPGNHHARGDARFRILSWTIETRPRRICWNLLGKYFTR